MGFAAGRRFLAAFLLPSRIIRPAMRIIAIRGRFSLWAVLFVRSFESERYYRQARYEGKKEEGEEERYGETEKKRIGEESRRAGFITGIVCPVRAAVKVHRACNRESRTAVSPLRFHRTRHSGRFVHMIS